MRLALVIFLLLLSPVQAYAQANGAATRGDRPVELDAMTVVIGISSCNP